MKVRRRAEQCAQGDVADARSAYERCRRVTLDRNAILTRESVWIGDRVEADEHQDDRDRPAQVEEQQRLGP